MVRTYVRKTQRGQGGNWEMASMISAMSYVGRGVTTVRHAAIMYNIPEPTLRRYIKKHTDDVLPMHGGRYKTTFSTKQEEELAEYILEFGNRGYGMTPIQARRIAFELAERNKIHHSFNRVKKIAGDDWLQGFLKRNSKISLRVPEATSLGRIMGFNKPKVDHFYNILYTLMKKYEFAPDQICNADESGLPTVPTKLPKVLSAKGRKRIAKVTSSERGKNITVVCCMNAAGTFIPPAFVFPRKYMKDCLMIGAPANSVGYANSTGWMNTEVFVKYLEHFNKFVKASPEKPVLLVVDNHISHSSLQAIDFCRAHGIILISLPPHCTHRMQPLDVTFFGPLKTFYSRACDEWMVNHPGKVITEYHVASLLNKAYLKAASIGIAVKGFEATGIFPFNQSIFSEIDFHATLVTERNQLENADSESVILQTSKDIALRMENIPTNFNSDVMVTNSSSDGIVDTNSSLKVNEVKCDPVSPLNIRPFPQCEPSTRNKRKSINARIITSTPNKIELEKKVEERIENKTEKKVSNPGMKSIKSMIRNEKKIQKHSRQKLTFTKKSRSLKVNSSDIECPACEEKYVEPPTEDWISCNKCNKWWHEACTGYEGNDLFTCDFCE